MSARPRTVSPMATCLTPLGLLLPLMLLSACADGPLRLPQPREVLRDELSSAAQQRPGVPAVPSVLAASAPTPTVAASAAATSPTPSAVAEPRFDLIVNGASVRDVFLSLVAETRYSMLIHPEVSGELSVTLKGVTLREALESIRDVYGYDFRVDGRRITVYPPSMQTRVFSVNYLQGQRLGRSELRVNAGGAPVANTGTSGSTGAPNSPANGGNTASGNSGSAGSVYVPESSQIATLTRSDFWADLSQALRALVGNEGGRSVIISPQAGTIAVRAMPDELRHVESYLRATRLAVERQVMLEAKIVEVELREGYQSGIDWSVLGRNGAVGQTGVNPSIPSGVSTILNPLVSNVQGLPVLSSGTQTPVWPDLIPLPSAGGGAFGLALSKGGFQGLLSFLQSHGDLQILSSPRVATLNNQKAVLKVGTDDYFVTGITGGNTGNTGTNANNNNGVSMPTLTLTPFFSGIALDVTPQIDEAGMITLHIHPAVTAVTEKIKQVDLGTVGNYRLPLASSSVNETDTVVRIPDGAIAAIGGLMQLESSRRGSGLPGAEQNPITATLFGNRANSGRKRELVVLIKPTIIRTADDWEQLSPRFDDDSNATRRVINVAPRSTKP